MRGLGEEGEAEECCRNQGIQNCTVALAKELERRWHSLEIVYKKSEMTVYIVRIAQGPEENFELNQLGGGSLWRLGCVVFCI